MVGILKSSLPPDATHGQMAGLEEPVEEFDAVVVGSGFGGSVVADRLAEGGLSVCLLERGKRYPPGSFPRSPRQVARNFWDPSRGLHGMFDVWTFRGLEAVVASGVGGGSLIYANVLLRKDPSWFVHERGEDWPVTYEELEEHYERVEQRIGTQSYPFDRDPYAHTLKTRELKQAAERLGFDWRLPPLAVTFANEGQPPIPGEPIEEAIPHNLHGRTRYTCRLVGECDIGCNYGSKNSLDFTYLSRFVLRPETQLRDRSEVRSIERRGGGFIVRYVRHEPDREGVPTRTQRLPLREVHGRQLVLSAGALGTPFLLLRNRASLGGLSPALGTRFSGNGDSLGFVTKSRHHQGAGMRALDPEFGPVITSAIRFADSVDGGNGRGFYLEDGGYPNFVNWMIEAIHVPGQARRVLSFVARWMINRLLAGPVSNISAELSHLVGEGKASSTRLAMLGMGRDTPDGAMRLRDGYLEIDWTIRTSVEYFARVRSAMRAIAWAMNGRFRQNPLWYLRRVITVHPLGGCPMGADESRGVVDSFGAAFGVPGLYVADGSVMPGPVGPNPSLTIAAQADRTAARILGEL
jgi:cholesterol oxidase